MKGRREGRREGRRKGVEKKEKGVAGRGNRTGPAGATTSPT